MAQLTQIPVFLATYIIPYIFVLSLVVFIHEMGHFWVGRWCGVKIDAFSLGFGPELWHHVDKKGTRWRLAALPLGGYVKFHGDLNGASFVDNDAVVAMSDADRAVTFFHQPVWKRAAIVVAGPIANFILAFVIFTGLLAVNGVDVFDPRVGEVRPDSPAQVAGFKVGDTILAIDGQDIKSFDELRAAVVASTGSLSFLVKRDAGTLTLVATPKDSIIGVGPVRASFHHESPSLIEAARSGLGEISMITTTTGDYLGRVVLGRVSPKEISGPIRIAEVSGEMAKRGIAAVLFLVGVISVSVGLLNLLPIPLLDGGHLLYFAFEAAKGKALRDRTQEFGFRIGITFVAGIMILAAYNDISRLVLMVVHPTK